jgi:biotin synthase
MNPYEALARKSLANCPIDHEDIRWILTDESVHLLDLLSAAYKVRHHYFGNKVRVHIINNVQSGNCSEDCKYCAQSKDAPDQTVVYPMKTEEEILLEAKNASEAGAYRYCMVYSGRDLGRNRIADICRVVGKIKARFDMEVCVSAGFLSSEEARALKSAGVDRYNHNLNTSRDFYPEICTTHDYARRIDTINCANWSGLDICSGVIIGMGEGTNDIASILSELRRVEVKSVPINFFIPVPGHRVQPSGLTPHYCLKVLCLFRLALPKAEIRAAGGREYHLRSLQALCLYPANSLFSKGYLTTGGECVAETKQMIIDSGFQVDAVAS